MRAPYSLSCLFLLSLGACCPPPEQQEPRRPGAGLQLGCPGAVPGAVGGCWRAAPLRSGSEELGTLLGIARELRGYDEGPRGRPEGSEKRGGTLGDLAEELSGYSRKKGGFAFRFGR